MTTTSIIDEVSKQQMQDQKTEKFAESPQQESIEDEVKESGDKSNDTVENAIPKISIDKLRGTSGAQTGKATANMITFDDSAGLSYFVPDALSMEDNTMTDQEFTVGSKTPGTYRVGGARTFKPDTISKTSTIREMDEEENPWPVIKNMQQSPKSSV